MLRCLHPHALKYGPVLHDMRRPLVFSTLSRLEFERAVLGRVVAGMPLAEVLEHVIHRVEALSGERLYASILLVDASGKRLVHGAAPSLPASYNAAIDGLEFGPLTGSCGAAAYNAVPVIVDDIETDPLWAVVSRTCTRPRSARLLVDADPRRRWQRARHLRQLLSDSKKPHRTTTSRKSRSSRA